MLINAQLHFQFLPFEIIQPIFAFFTSFRLFLLVILLKIILFLNFEKKPRPVFAVPLRIVECLPRLHFVPPVSLHGCWFPVGMWRLLLRRFVVDARHLHQRIEAGIAHRLGKLKKIKINKIKKCKNQKYF